MKSNPPDVRAIFAVIYSKIFPKGNNSTYQPELDFNVPALKQIPTSRKKFKKRDRFIPENKDTIEAKPVKKYVINISDAKIYLENKSINSVKDLSESVFCKEMIDYISTLYFENGNIANTANILDVKPTLLRDYFSKAKYRLNAFDYKGPKKSLKILLEKHRLNSKIKLSKNYSNNKYEDKNPELIIECLKKYYSIQKVSKMLNISYNYIRQVVYSKYNCQTISELRQKLKLEKTISQEKIEKLKNISDIYKKTYSLQKAADELGITRERVRQILREGDKYGICTYLSRSEREENYFEELAKKYDKKDFIQEIKTLISPRKICTKLNIDRGDFNKLLEYFNIDYQEYQRLARQEKCLEEYSLMVDILGHHPSTTEMNSRPDWRRLWIKIDRYWGSIDNFRKEFGIERPKYRIHPNTLSGFKKNMEIKSEIKNEKKREILNFIKEKGNIGPKSIMEKFDLKRPTLSGYIRDLLKEGLIIKSGVTSKTRYILKVI